jgi:transcriptional regulator GlxA family with amidase domain
MEQVPGDRRTRPNSTPAQAVVERIEAYAQSHLSASVPISELCRIAGLSERGLRNAFYRVRGMSPKRSLRADRLRGARRALAGGNGPRTVTGIATRYGFYELGRFAAVYKESFGEAPSQTLRGTARKAGTGNAIETKGHGDVCSS